MSLSTLTRCHPPVCPRKHREPEQWPKPEGILDLQRIFNATKIAGMATLLSQLVTSPLDVGTRAIRRRTTSANNVISAAFQIVCKKGASAAFEGLPLHLIKRVPTKALTVALFELGTQILGRTSLSPGTLSPFQHMTVATASGAIALLATYPLHLCYYAVRKDIAFSQIASRVQTSPRVLYAGAFPALLGTAPAVLTDYVVYRGLRRRIEDFRNDEVKRKAFRDASLVIVAAATSNLMGGFISEPFKALSRKIAVESIRSDRCSTFHGMAGTMLSKGLGEFWRGFPVRSFRYAISAIVSKTAVQHLKDHHPPSNTGNGINERFLRPYPAIQTATGGYFSPKRGSAAHLKPSSSSHVMTHHSPFVWKS